VLQKIWKGVQRASSFLFLLSLDYHSKQFSDERRLSQAVCLVYSSHLSFSEHMRHLISLQSSPSCLKMRRNPSLVSPVVCRAFDEVRHYFRPHDRACSVCSNEDRLVLISGKGFSHSAHLNFDDAGVSRLRAGQENCRSNILRVKHA
jgi:hypothetical protein